MGSIRTPRAHSCPRAFRRIPINSGLSSRGMRRQRNSLWAVQEGCKALLWIRKYGGWEVWQRTTDLEKCRLH
jgi:hypothetical protein